ncbi:MAG: glycosyltransferase family 2 protein [Ruminococcaceae bacterium]|nr:glycosyltransferase family 2 protein [Oscillospiraceae bacterium]
MENEKLLTITVPCYNSEDYLKNCIESLLVGKERVEIIIINDGSTDSTGKIADEYADNYPDIVKVVHQENGGHGEGINQGIKHATGKYFKVVDSDDTLSADFPAFLDALERCESEGGIDLAVTNYYYVHPDSVGDRSINYSNALPRDRIFGWSDTRRFRAYQMLTIHSCTFRTDLLRLWDEPLPKKVFYEDNLMICKTLPRVKSMYYLPIDLYRYWIGRPDQSVQESAMKKRYSHQILVTEKSFVACDIENLKEPKLKRYLKHEMFLMFGISIMFTRLNRSDETDAALEKMWDTCREHDRKWANHYRYCSPLALICIGGKFGRSIAMFFYRIANKIVKFN